MLRILGKISIFGTSAGLERLISVDSIPNGTLQQVGVLRKVPDTDSWCYGSPWYTFHADAIDEETHSFLTAHARLGEILAVQNEGIKHSIFTLCPVKQSYEETFACLLSQETLRTLVRLDLALEIAPAAIMPDAEYWISKTMQ